MSKFRVILLAVLSACVVAGVVWASAGTPGVSDKPSAKEINMMRCTSGDTYSKRYDCIATAANKIYDSYGLKRLERELDKISENRNILKNCHFASHPIGYRIGKRDAKEGKKRPTFVATTTHCGQGLAHGITIGFLDNASVTQLNAFDPVRDCPNVEEDITRKKFTGCVHGLGHAAFLHVKSLVQAYDICVSAGNRMPSVAMNVAAQFSCGYGVAMQRTQTGEGPVTDCGPKLPQFAKLRLSCLGYLKLASFMYGDNVKDAQKTCDKLAITPDEKAMCRLDQERFLRTIYKAF